VDPYSTFPLQPDGGFATLPSVAVDRTSGRLHVVWQDARFSDGDPIDVACTTSADEGHTWSAPVRINKTTGDVPAFVPTVAVMADGTVGVSHYACAAQRRQRSPSSPMSGCSPAGAIVPILPSGKRPTSPDPSTWRAPFGRGFFLGDYVGLAGSATGFLLLYAATNPAGSPSFADAYFATVAVP
jgi:hypothetical protein